jgi:hypothetical protein
MSSWEKQVACPHTARGNHEGVQLALNDWTGGGDRYRQLAVAKLDEAYAELANAQVIGD